MNPLVSICIPTYEMKGKGVEYLHHSFNILHNQSYKNFEVIISDNSKNEEIKNLCINWNNRLNIKHYFNHEKFGNSKNINFAIKKSSGDIIKILFQDDFLFDSDSLFHQIFHFMGNHNQWLVTACCHTNDGINFHNSLYPKYHDNIQYGENTISSPSVLMFKNEDVLEFDENLLYLMDVDYYKRLYNKFGLPSICNYITVVNRSHENQLQLNCSNELKQSEFIYIKQKYSI